VLPSQQWQAVRGRTIDGLSAKAPQCRTPATVQPLRSSRRPYARPVVRPLCVPPANIGKLPRKKNMHASVKAKLASFLKEYEGRFGYMYLDVKALVTVGIGNKIDPINQALKLEFQPKGASGSVASAADVTAEWQLVKSRQDLMQQGAPAFDAITKLELSDTGISTLVAGHAAAIENYITTNATAQKFYANFADWPADAQLGFLGVAWGGIPLPQFGWHAFPEACRVEDWATAAKECRISSPIHAGRNDAHKRMFENAAQAKANGDKIELLNWPAVLVATVKIEGE
jgi:hypothetical protein